MPVMAKIRYQIQNNELQFPDKNGNMINYNTGMAKEQTFVLSRTEFNWDVWR